MVEGVDFSDHIQLVHEVMKFHNITEYELHKADFLNFQHKPYDVVVSFGFLEHFTNWKQMLKKHLQMTSPGGHVIVSVPNLQRFQYILHKVLDPQFETEQVVEATDLDSIKKCISDSGYTLLYAGYYQTFHFFAHHRENSRSWWRQLIINVLVAIGAFFTRLRINLPNRWFSPPDTLQY